MERTQLVSLVTAAQRGKADAMNRLFNEFYNDVYYFALKTVKCEELACDITQDTFIRVIESIGTLSEPAAFVTWMKQITYRLCLNSFRAAREVPIDTEEDAPSPFDLLEEDRAEFIPDEALDQQDFRETILSMLDQLSAEQRSATMLYYYDELSVKQIAQIQGVAEGTVKSRLNYARKSLRTAVEDYEKKSGVRLHSVGLFPLLAWLFATGRESMPAGAAASAAAGVAAATGIGLSVSAAGTGALVSIPLGIKAAVAAVLSLAVMGGAAAVVSSHTAPPPSTPSQAVTLSQSAPSQALPASEPSQVLQTTPTTVPETDPVPTVPSETQATEPAESAPTSPTEVTVSEDLIGQGCSYITADGVTLQAGQPMPETVTLGDQYLTPGYTYYYDTLYGGGWHAKVNDTTATACEPLLARINGAPLVDLWGTFQGCSNMTEAPAIPEGVVQMYHAFDGCSSLLTAPALPQSVTNLGYAFLNCSSLTAAPVIPDSVTILTATFSGCTSLTAPPEIPDSVTEMAMTFRQCTSLHSAPTIPAGVTSLYETFYFCSSMVTPPKILGNVIRMNYTFYACEALTEPPVLPQTVTDLSWTFAGCYALSYAPAIPAGVTEMEAAFKWCRSIQTAPAIPSGVTSLNSTFYACTSLTTAPAIPENVTNLMWTFFQCSSLTGEIQIDAEPELYTQCFFGTQAPIVLTGSSTCLSQLAGTSTAGNISVK